MKEDKVLIKKVRKFTDCKESSIIFDVMEKKIDFVQLGDKLLGQGQILDEDFDNKIYTINIKTGLIGLNIATISIQLRDFGLSFAAYAKEGLIKQNSAQKAINKIKALF